MDRIDSHDYNVSWTQWIDCEIYGPTMRHQRRNIKKLTDQIRFDTILDIGGGSGDCLGQIIKGRHVEKIDLLDISSQALCRAKKRIPAAGLIEMDIQKESVHRQYDLVLCCDVLEHINDDVAALKNIRKMTEKFVVISTLCGRMRDSEKNVGHVRNYSFSELQEKLLSCGFKPIKTIRWGFPFYSPLYRNLWNRIPQEVNYGKWGPVRKLCAQILFVLFMLNSSKRGDYLFILAEPKS